MIIQFNCIIMMCLLSLKLVWAWFFRMVHPHLLSFPHFPKIELIKVAPEGQNRVHLYFSPTLGINERVNALRDQGVEILHLGFGESPFPVHPLIQAALAANTDKNMYLPSAGLSELRVLARDYYAYKFGIDAQAYRAIIGPGSKELLFDIQFALEGDLLLPVPSWVSYAPQADLTGDHVIKIPTCQAENYHITAGSLENAILAARRDKSSVRLSPNCLP